MLTNTALFLLALATTARLNRLAVRDVIAAPLRLAIAARVEKHRVMRFTAAILECIWCTGIYTAFAVAAYLHWITGWDWWLYPLTAMTLAWAAPVLAARLED